ncbi:hypothetical protein AB4212_54680, partial [Streptomyces sp. 2MCAF27]
MAGRSQQALDRSVRAIADKLGTARPTHMQCATSRPPAPGRGGRSGSEGAAMAKQITCRRVYE